MYILMVRLKIKADKVEELHKRPQLAMGRDPLEMNRVADDLTLFRMEQIQLNLLFVKYIMIKLVLKPT